MKYSVVSDFSKIRLMEDVNKMILEGWQVFGGVAVAAVGGKAYYSQALIKEREKKEPKKYERS